MNIDWQAFVDGFCKVEFVCYAKEPHWLGWIIIGIGCVIVFGLCGWIMKEVVAEILRLLIELKKQNRK